MGGTLTPTGGMIQRECAKKEQPEGEKKKTQEWGHGSQRLKVSDAAEKTKETKTRKLLVFPEWTSSVALARAVLAAHC